MFQLVVPPEHPFTFGEYLRELRRQHDLTLEQVVALSEGMLSRTTLSIVEREDTIPNSRILEGLGKAYGLPSPYLYAVAYVAQEKRNPAEVGSLWEEFKIELPTRSSDLAPSIHVPQVTRELLNLGASTVRFYGTDSQTYFSLEATRLSYVLPGDIIAVDAARQPTRDVLGAGWWTSQNSLLLYRPLVEQAPFPVRQSNTRAHGESLDALEDVDPLGIIIWRAGASPR